VACGISTKREDHIEAMLYFALDLRIAIGAKRDPQGNEVKLRIGVSTGPVSCGVIGHKRYWFDIWGTYIMFRSNPGNFHGD
jgi:class 3 adenylate cyclase